MLDVKPNAAVRAYHFNLFFTNVAQSLVSKLPLPWGRYGLVHLVRVYRSRNVTANMFRLSEVSVDQVQKILENIRSNKAAGLDKLPGRFLKDSSSVIAEPLTHLINLPIDTGSCPDYLKRLGVCPYIRKIV